MPKVWKVGRNERQAMTINHNIDIIHHKARQCFDELRFSGEEFTIEDLVDKIRGNEPPPQTLLEYVNIKIADLEERVSIDLAKTTFYKYKRTKVYLEEFLFYKHKIRNIAVSRVDANFLTQFFQFLRREKNNGHNSALALINCLKTILQIPLKNGVIRTNPFGELKISAKTVYRDYLTMEDIQCLENLELESEFLTRTKNIFLFACYTGLAYSDILQLKKDDIILENDGTFHISKPRQKTGVLSIILHSSINSRSKKRYFASAG
jgi:integrase